MVGDRDTVAAALASCHLPKDLPLHSAETIEATAREHGMQVTVRRIKK
jgi:hypothetical protein